MKSPSSFIGWAFHLLRRILGESNRRPARTRDEAGHKTVPADCFAPAESERPTGREVAFFSLIEKRIPAGSTNTLAQLLMQLGIFFVRPRV